MAADAHRLIEASDYRGAKQILAAAAQDNATAQSPLVYQYTANLAVMTGELFMAIGAQEGGAAPCARQSTLSEQPETTPHGAVQGRDETTACPLMRPSGEGENSHSDETRVAGTLRDGR